MRDFDSLFRRLPIMRPNEIRGVCLLAAATNLCRECFETIQQVAASDFDSF
jgi:hypothetical protein